MKAKWTKQRRTYYIAAAVLCAVQGSALEPAAAAPRTIGIEWELKVDAE